ncbi:YdcH family protein [Devosia sp. A16]|uniref:YdcH family protein n=1 Tax=Devosia sp. A16 TaxID=1736675 RepID=UPI002FF683FB
MTTPLQLFDPLMVTKISRPVDVQACNSSRPTQNQVQSGDRSANPFGTGISPRRGTWSTAAMLPLTKEQEAALGLELAAKRQEHADLDAAIHTLSSSGYADQMLIQRMKKRKLTLKDRIVQLENILLPDIIA